jgi:hypothetical protein
MTKSISQTINDLRAQLVDIEGRQAELIADRDEHSFAAVVERQPQAIKKLAAINSELDNLKHRAASLQAALREATKRENAAAEAEAAEVRRRNAREADVLCSDAEAIAEKLDAAFAALALHAQEYEAAMGAIRRKINIGPQFDHVRVFLVRALRTAIHRTPLHLDAISPVDQTTVSQASASWLRNIRGQIARTLNSKPAAKEAA